MCQLFQARRICFKVTGIRYSHQIGLDVDIWFAPMPDQVQSREEREFASATDVVAPDLRDVD
ncbi:MAG TPA: penicillin-insensitive murein endopeptidase, partial [Bradyrhizobium sp.]|nr:penicillin-insensitive murein endopeptidase [Bradyrhizobium sp.]